MSKHLSTSVRVPIESDNPSIVRNESLCIKCGQCRNVCTSPVGVLGTYALEQTGDRAICIHCGQCANVCPVGSITEVYEYTEVKAAVQDKDKIVIVSTSPSVRVALGEEFGMPKGAFVQGKMVALLRALGVDYVLDTNFAADLTIVEEASELLARIKGETDKPLPQFTSCCPAWVKFAETYYPELLPHVSTAKSPIGMQGPTIKTYFAQKMGIDPRKIVNVALTPCTAKKFEIRREEMNAAGQKLGIAELRDMDNVITTRELALWAKEAGIDFTSLEDSDFDKFMGEASGAGVIFGNTGGVMEAALRTAYAYLTGEQPPKEILKLEPVRGYDGLREASVEIAGRVINVAVVHGTEAERAGQLDGVAFFVNLGAEGAENAQLIFDALGVVFEHLRQGLHEVYVSQLHQSVDNLYRLMAILDFAIKNIFAVRPRLLVAAEGADEAGAGSVGIHGAAAFFALYSTTFVVFFKHRNISLPYLAFIIAQKECQRPTRKGNFG